MAAINIELLSPVKEDLKGIGEVKSLQSLDSSGQSFKADGLYSIDYFGVSGSIERNNIFAYISLKIPVIHPKLYDVLTSLSVMYKQIINGTLRVKFDKKESDFVVDDDGDTGYTFLLENLSKIKFKRNNSKKRDDKIDLLYKAIKDNKVTYTNLLVLPAGLRDYEITKDGRPSEDEVNDLYRAAIRTSGLILDKTDNVEDLKIIDPIRIKLQKDINEIYSFLFSLIDGKKKFLRGGWIKRGIDYGTRNIFSGIPIEVNDLDDIDNVVKPYETIVGVLQTAKAFLPLAFFKIKEIFLNDILSSNGSQANLVDVKTNKQKTIELSKAEFDKWATRDGIDSILNRTVDDEIKNSPIVIEGHYLKLIFDNGKEIKLIDDIDYEEDMDMKYVRPITYGELMFLSLIDIAKKYPITIARHPIIEEGSTFYSFIKLHSTIKSRTVTNLKTKEVINKYPVLGKEWINTIGVHYTRLSSMDADFDGDKGPLIGYMTKESVEEANRQIKDMSFYVNVGGSPTMDLIDEITLKTIKSISKI